MNIVNAFKQAGKPNTVKFVRTLAKSKWERNDFNAAALYAASSGAEHLFDWAFPLSHHFVYPHEVMKIAAHSGHGFVIDAALKGPMLGTKSKELVRACAASGLVSQVHDLLNRSKSIIPNEEELQAALLAGARNGQLGILQNFLNAKHTFNMKNSVVLAAVRSGHKDCVDFVVGLLSEKEQSNIWKNILHEAVVNAHPHIAQELLNANQWARARKAVAKQWNEIVLQHMKHMFTISQDPDKKYEMALLLSDHLSYEQWEKSCRFVNPIHAEFMNGIYSYRQKKVLNEAIGKAEHSSTPRRKM